MENIYHVKCLELILAISKALDKMEVKDYAAAEEILRNGWEKAAGKPPPLILR